MSGKVEALAHFGVVLKNDRWSWSGRSPDGKVVVQLWKDLLNYKAKPVSYTMFGDRNLAHWINLPGNRERIENLKWSITHCGGLFHVVIGVAKDVKAITRDTEGAYPQSRMVMRITELDEETGEFSAEMTEGA